MAKVSQQSSTKRLAISQANARMIAVVAAASVVSIFSLVGAKALWSQNAYQAKVNGAKENAHHQLEANLQAADELTKSYKTFASKDVNVLGGSKTGTGDNEGDNSKIILDALPGSYDFPALTSSIEKIMNERHYPISSFMGIDDQINQQDNSSSNDPQPQPIPFSFTVENANYTAVQQIASTLELSIRPIQIDSLKLSGGASDMKITIEAHTFYQPQKSLTIKKQVVK